MQNFSEMSGMFTMLLIPYVVFAALGSFLVVYILNWLRGLRGEKDSLLGGKVLYTMLFTVGFQILLLGISLFMPAMVKNGSGDLNGMQYMNATQQQKPLAQPNAFITSGILIGAYGLGMMLALSRRGGGDAQVFRQGLGINAASAGMVACVGLVLWLSALFKSGFSFEDQIDVVWMMLVYFVGHVFCVLPLIKMSSDEISPPAPGKEAAATSES